MSSIHDHTAKLAPGTILRGPVLPEPIEVVDAVPIGDAFKIRGSGLRTHLFHQIILTAAQLALLHTSPAELPFDGDADRFRLAVEAMRLGLAYEYDPLFSLSIARVDPLPHQLEAVYEYFLKLPRIRFLLADDPGAGKTIMAGLLIKELKIRGLVKRILILTPANLTFQWQREMLDKFREPFQIVRGDVLRANYGSNPWQEQDQLITSVSWVSTKDDARESLLHTHWDLIIVDEAHKMSAYADDKKTLAYRLGEALSAMTDHFLLMTATPHKGDPEHFRRFLALLDADVYADASSLEEAMRRKHAPFYLRRLKESMVSFPDPITGQVHALFTRRDVRTSEFRIDADEMDFYEALTSYVEEQSVKAGLDNTARGRALGFTMAMLQRRFASSVRAARRSLERMLAKREEILVNPAAYRQAQIEGRLPDNYDELPDEDQQQVMQGLEEVVASVDPVALRAEIRQLGSLIHQAVVLEDREVESKLVKLRAVLEEQGLFADPAMKLLIFTEHTDTLTYLVEKLAAWGLSTTQIHGGMKIGDRDTPGTRIYAEREFRETCQVMVATEAAGEGINLQFCWLMINYDIPWSPIRLEQRMGRIHRYGQEKDCLIFNFVSSNTREGRVLHKLFLRLREIEDALDPERTGKVFNVLGDIFPANELEQLVRRMYARNLTEAVITDRIVEEVDLDRFRNITRSTLEGLAQRELNLAAILGRAEEAKERRLVPEVVEDFFLKAGPIVGVFPREVGHGQHIFRLGRVPRNLWPFGERAEGRFGRMGHEYGRIVFDKDRMVADATLEWVTPGHALFEAVREGLLDQAGSDLARGAVFYDLNHSLPAKLAVYSAAVRDGRGHALERRLFVVESWADGALEVRQPTIFLGLIPAPQGTAAPDGAVWLGADAVEAALVQDALTPFRDKVDARRQCELLTIGEHLEISLNALINRVQVQFGELEEKWEAGVDLEGIEGRLRNYEVRLEELNSRLERRQAELDQERHCTIADIQRHGEAWVLPHPDRFTPTLAPMVSDPEIERIAVDAVIAHEAARGWRVQSVERDNVGFDLISRRPHPDDPGTAIALRYIEVKGRAHVGEVALSDHEYKTAQRLAADYWLYVVYNCATAPEVHVIPDPARLGWKPVMAVEHYTVPPATILEASQ